MKDRETLTGKVNFGIITIRDDEYREVLNQLGQTSIVDGKNQRRYRVSSLMCLNGSEAVVAVTRCSEQGNVEAQRAASDLIQDLDPNWILVVGIAGGVPDSDFSLGDVVVSSRVYDLTLEAANLGGEREYSIKGDRLHDLAQRIVQDIPGMTANELRGWHSKVDMKRPDIDLEGLDRRLVGNDDEWKRRVRDSLSMHFSQDRPPVALPGAIASSDRLVKDLEITATWKTVARHIKAIEMELAGVCRQVGNTPVLGIRGISDIVGLQREDVWTPYACKAAAAFAISLICSSLMPFPKQPVEAQNKLRLQLISEMTKAASTLYMATQNFWRKKDIEKVGNDELAQHREELDQQYRASRVVGEVLERRLEACFLSSDPKALWHATMDLLTVRYFHLIGLATENLLRANAGEEHTGLSVEQLRDQGLVLKTYREKLTTGAQAVLQGPIRVLAG